MPGELHGYAPGYSGPLQIADCSPPEVVHDPTRHACRDTSFLPGFAKICDASAVLATENPGGDHTTLPKLLVLFQPLLKDLSQFRHDMERKHPALSILGFPRF